ncbi:MAG: DNA polymerase III subunit gamma/tau [Acholeplasmatales bacterium]|nr:DNA polymerase III subunit gamma/tau [Acholeplasmatales bacterium]
MAYVALYRAYRPQNFNEVVGQEHIIKTLQNAIKLNKVAHAYLFCGPRGTGKTTLAKIMAKAMNCENGPTPNPCCECEICQGIAKGTISDVIEIDAASNNGADDIRALRETVKFLPSQGKYKVYIIDEVHMLSTAAFNALLKTLEEPPKHVIFILATTEPYKLPNTILSRCQRFDFQAISINDIVKRLKIVANEENIKISDEAIVQIASSAEGGMRDALSLFDQCISYSVNEEISIDDVLAVSGNVNYVKIIELLNSCRSENETDAIMILNSIIKEGKEVPRIVNDTILFLRDVLLFKNNAVIEDKLMFKNELFINLANNISRPIIYQWLDILNDSLNQMRFSTQKRAFLELAILKMNDVKLNNEADMVDRIESLEKTVNLLSNQLSNQNQRPNRGPNHNYSFTPSIPSAAEIENMRRQSQINSQPMIETPNVQPNFEENNVSIENTSINENKNQLLEQNVVLNQTPISVSQSQQNVVEESSPISTQYPDEINISDIENILNKASKSKREALMSVWGEISDNSNIFAVQILVRGKIVAVSDDAFIVELQDLGFCNRVMEYTNFQKIIEVFNDAGVGLKDYICVPSAVWANIIKDYKSKYNKETNPKPKLDDIRIGVKRRIVPKEQIKEETDEDKIASLFEENTLKIMEE